MHGHHRLHIDHLRLGRYIHDLRRRGVDHSRLLHIDDLRWRCSHDDGRWTTDIRDLCHAAITSLGAGHTDHCCYCH